jgi:adenosine deaminase
MEASYWRSLEFIRAIPKSDLHVHLDGSLRIATLIELAQQQKISLPSSTETGLRKLVFKTHYSDLGEYLQGFQYTCAVLRNPEALERVAYELAWDNFREGVLYIEPRFAPQLQATADISIEEVLKAVDEGLRRAKREINRDPEIAAGGKPPFDYGIIGCAMRKFDERFSPYYGDFISCHRYTPMSQVYPLASLELAHALVRARDEKGIPVVGFDLAGEEKGWPANAHRKAFEFAHQHFLKKTLHAGEAYGPSSIFQAITQCHADRIGHGTHLFAAELLKNLPADEREPYTQALVQYVSDRRITVEVCLSSNLQTTPTIRSLPEHPLKKMLEGRLSLTICTDNRLVSNTTVVEEIQKMVNTFPVTPHELKEIIVYGFKRSFSPLPYVEKRHYVRQIINYYEEVEERFAKPQSAPSSSPNSPGGPLGDPG